MSRFRRKRHEDQDTHRLGYFNKRKVKNNMSHPEQLKKTNYRNWVKGGLALRYLKDGLVELVDTVSKQEHAKLVKALHLSGKSCNQCNAKTLRPLHTSILDSGTKKSCPKHLKNCNCLRTNTKCCPNKICDSIYEEILNNCISFQPNLINTDIKKWSTNHWDVTKCFINAPGYEKTQTVAETDVAGLLHLFANGKHFQSHVDDISLFLKLRDWRNNVFHSPDMELEDDKLKDGISDIMSVLVDMENKKNIRAAKQSLVNLKAIQTEKFIITVETEAEVCRESHASLARKIEELERDHREAKKDIAIKEERARHFQGESLKSQGDVQRNVIILQERVNQHEDAIQSLNERVTTLEENVAKLKEIQANRNAYLKSTTERINVKKKLRELYQKDYVKTSVSPLETKEHNIEIRDVYVTPEMVKVIDGTAENGETEARIERIHNYGDVFSSDGVSRKRIYMLGDVGSGKSAFCKMMISNWCKSQESQKETKIDKNVESQEPQKETKRDKNVEGMEEFDFLFYLPLRYFSMLQGCSDIRDMVLKYYEKIGGKETLNDILTSMPERCLILEDGLDEWKPKEDEFHREDETLGLPSMDIMDTVTVLTTSRPSAQGILNMKPTDFDCKIILRGIEETSIDKLVKGYISKIRPRSGKQPNADDILLKLKQVEIQNLEKTPLLLQYIIWLSYTENEIGKSVSEVYINLLNLSMRWTEKKYTAKQKEFKRKDVHTFENLSLPEQIKYFPACDSHQSIIFVVSKLAFEILTQRSKMHFGRNRLEEYGVDDDLLSNILQSGLLTEEKRLNPIPEDTQFTFTHTSFVEFFAALYIASHNVTSSEPNDGSQFLLILEKLFGTILAAEKVLQLENVLLMVCGLAPKTTQAVCQYIYNCFEQDTKFSKQRKKFYDQLIHETAFDKREEYISMTKRCMKLVDRCVCESKVNDSSSTPLRIPLLDIVIDFDFKRYKHLIIELADTDLARHLLVKDFFIHVPVPKLNHFENILKFEKLQTLSIEWFSLTQDELILFARFLTETVTLEYIHISDTSHSDRHKKSPNSEMVDLSSHDQLQTLSVSSKVVRFHEINTTNLETCIMDGVRTTFLLVGCPNLRNLKLSYTPLKHEEFSSLTKTVTQAVPLRNIKMWGISCTDHGTSCSHEISLSDHAELQVLDVTDNESLHFAEINTLKLERCVADRPDLVHLLKGAPALQELDLRELTYSQKEHDSILSINSLKKLKLRWTIVGEGVLVLTPALSSIEFLKLENVTMSLSSWKIFVDSLLALNHSVTVERHWPLSSTVSKRLSARRHRQSSIGDDATEAEARNYVSLNQGFDIEMPKQFMPDDLGGFTFKSITRT